MGEVRVVPVIGLEIHAELATRTKLFCRCANIPDSPANSLVCPVCLGLPGALPVLNREALRLSVLAGLALGGRIPRISKWDRKSYTYPDLPKNYQISQYDLPVSSGGQVDVTLRDGRRKRVDLDRAHLEEDAGRTIHDAPQTSGVDLNRAGVPLLEIVSRPVLESAEEAGEYAREVRSILRWIGASEAIMEQGQIRFEPNINLHISEGDRSWRTPITEVKNLNSFRALEGAVDFEIGRQLECWRKDPDGYTIERAPRENRGYDAERAVTVFQREKEEVHDYRYFPDPDLVAVVLDVGWVEPMRSVLCELPASRRLRYRETYGLQPKDVDVLTEDVRTGDILDKAVVLGATAKRAASLLTGVGSRIANDSGRPLWGLVSAEQLQGIVGMVEAGDLTPTAANTLFTRLAESGGEAQAVAAVLGLLVRRDAAELDAWVRDALASNPKAVSDVKSGGKNAAKAFGYLMGQVMQRSRGAASPADVEHRLKKALGA